MKFSVFYILDNVGFKKKYFPHLVLYKNISFIYPQNIVFCHMSSNLIHFPISALSCSLQCKYLQDFLPIQKFNCIKALLVSTTYCSMCYFFIFETSEICFHLLSLKPQGWSYFVKYLMQIIYAYIYIMLCNIYIYISFIYILNVVYISVNRYYMRIWHHLFLYLLWKSQHILLFWLWDYKKIYFLI